MAYADIIDITDIGRRRRRSEPSPELTAEQKRLDTILRHTQFSHKTKALWAYYRGNESSKRYGRHSRIKAVRLIRVNRALNGAWYNFNHILPETIAHWEHAIKLIDIALNQ